ncbi:MAG: hypothetical protein R3B48_01515 [Kofleriaceae bacterium]
MSPHRPPRAAGVWLPALWAIGLALGACARPRPLPTVPPPAPILADDPSTPATAEEECGQAVTHLRRYSECALIEVQRREWLGRWLEAIERDLAIAGQPGIDDASRQQIAVACHKAARVLHRTADRCLAEAAARPPARAQ